MVVHTSNPSTERLRQEHYCKFEASVDYIVRPCVKNQGEIVFMESTFSDFLSLSPFLAHFCCNTVLFLFLTRIGFPQLL